MTSQISIAPPVAGDASDALTAADAAAMPVRRPLLLAMGMLFLGALPDGLVAPLLDNLFVQRYGAGVAASHWFMVVNLIGALAAVPLLGVLRKRFSPSILLAAGALCSGVLLAVMALPIGFAATMMLRVFEGAGDLIMLAIIFDLLGKAGTMTKRGARFGAAGTVLLLGLATGVIGGGMLGQSVPVLAFSVGAAACFVIAVTAILFHARFDGLVRSCPAVDVHGKAVTTRRKPLWPAMVLAGGDRAVAGLTATTVVFYFAHVLDLDPAMRGMMLGLSMLMLAIGAWPAGWIGDRVGHLRVRTIASVAYGCSLALVPLVSGQSIAATFAIMLALGLAGSFLMPTTITLASDSGRGSVAMAGYHASGNIGYHLIGVGGAATLLTVLAPGDTPDAGAYHTIILAFAAAHLVLSLAGSFALRGSR